MGHERRRTCSRTDLESERRGWLFSLTVIAGLSAIFGVLELTSHPEGSPQGPPLALGVIAAGFVEGYCLGVGQARALPVQVARRRENAVRPRNQGNTPWMR